MSQITVNADFRDIASADTASTQHKTEERCDLVMPTLPLDAYTVGWICVKAENEAVAARAMMDEKHGYIDLAADDPIKYFAGMIGKHNVVIGCTGEAGLNSASYVASNMVRSFKNIKIGLLCGIGGGNPSTEHDIRLGDVVIGMPDGTHGGVIQYNYGKARESGIIRTISHNRPPSCLLQAVENRKTDMIEGRDTWQTNLRQAPDPWRSFEDLDDTLHEHQSKSLRPTGRGSRLHYGLIGSGDLVVKNDKSRASLVNQINDDVLCFEMEAAGLVNTFPCLVVRGISDYCDQHKNDDWQGYASSAAAAYCKYILHILHASDAQDAPKAAAVVAGFSDGTCSLSREQRYRELRSGVGLEISKPADARPLHSGMSSLTSRGMRALCLADQLAFILPTFVSTFRTYNYATDFHRVNQNRYPLTCQWIIGDDDISWWCARTDSTVLWISGYTGVGKSTLLTHIVASLKKSPRDFGIRVKSVVLFAFCSETRNTATGAISVVIHQLLLHCPALQKVAYQYEDENLASICGSAFDTSNTHLWATESRTVLYLWNLLCHLVKKSDYGRVLLVFDGLDECDLRSKEGLLRIFQSAAWEMSRLSVLFSSQPDPGLTTSFSSWSQRAPEHFRHKDLALDSDKINSDIEHYVKQEIQRIGGDKGIPEGGLEWLKEILVRECSSLFLPVVLILKEIEDEPVGGRSVKEIVANTPRDLKTQYLNLLPQLQDTLSTSLAPISGFLLYSVIPLTVRDLVFLRSDAEARQRDLLPAASSLDKHHLETLRHEIRGLSPMLVLRNEGDTVDFIHPSAKEFLKTCSSEGKQGFLPASLQSHVSIAIACLRLIISKSDLDFSAPWEAAKTIERKKKAISACPFLSYALRYWSTHLKSSAPSDGVVNFELMKLVQDFLRVWNQSSEGLRSTLLENGGMSKINQQMCKQTSMIELLSFLGLDAYLKPLLALLPLNHRQYLIQIESALLLAIKGGHEKTFDLLTQYFNITSLDDRVYKNAIKDSAWTGDQSLLRKVMNMRKPQLDELIQAIRAAFSTGEAATLDEIGKDRFIFSERCGWGRTALHHLLIALFGVAQGSTQTLKQCLYIVRNKVDINCCDSFGFTALHYACWSKELCTKTLIEGLIKEGADPFILTKGGLSAFHFAVTYARHPDVIESLLRTTSYRVLGMRSKGENTPLHWAVGRCLNNEEDFEILTILIRSGADPYFPNRRGISAFEKARYRSIAYALQQAYASAGRTDQHLISRPATYVFTREGRIMESPETRNSHDEEHMGVMAEVTLDNHNVTIRQVTRNVPSEDGSNLRSNSSARITELDDDKTGHGDEVPEIDKRQAPFDNFLFAYFS